MTEARKLLWKHGVTVQEFLGYVAYLLATGDKRAFELLTEAKKAKAKEQTLNIQHTDEESLYNLIEHLKIEKKEK